MSLFHKNLFSLSFSVSLLVCQLSCNEKQTQSYSPYVKDSVCVLPVSGESTGNYSAFMTADSMMIDGEAIEKSWEKAVWRDIKYKWQGEEYSQQDFQGRYKILWNENEVFFLVEIVDNVLSDQHKDPLNNWWEDDGLVLYIDENRSKGEHQFNHNAFAYHIALDNNVVDFASDKKPRFYNDQIQVKRTNKGKLYTWEVAMKVFPDTYKEENKNSAPVKLQSGKKMGFAVAYNDNDATNVRENSIGSIEISGEDKNAAEVDAGVFGLLELY